MTPVLFDLPLNPTEAGVLAGLVVEQAQGKRLTEDLRGRLAGQAAILRFETITPWLGSLERDPVHPDAYYAAVDGAKGQPLLLHMAPASAPASGIYAKSLLIGRMRTPGGREIVVNAIPFGLADTANVRCYAEKVNRAFLPRPQGSRPSIAAAGGNLPAAFEGFRSVFKKHALNLASVSPYGAGLWAAIRAGWREGYTAEAELAAGAANIAEFAACTRFTTYTAPDPGESLQENDRLYAAIRRAKSSSPTGRSFDFAPSLAGAAQPTTPADLAFYLESLKARGCPAQLVAPRLDLSLPPEELGARVRELAAAARQHGATLSIEPGRNAAAETLAAVSRAAAGRVSFRVAGEFDAAYIEWVAERLMA